MNAHPERRSTQFAGSLLLALGAFVVFVLLPQRTFHGFDTDYYAALLQTGGQQPTAHVAFLPLCKLVLSVVRWWGGGAVQAMWLTSALGSAVGVFCLHRAALRLREPDSALVVPIAVALTPACFYFATAAEIHGVFAAGSGAAWWAFARWRDEPRLGRAVALGAVCGAAATIHAFGHLLSPMFVGIALLQKWLPWRRAVVPAAAIAIVHVAVAAAVAWALGRGASGQGAGALAMLAAWCSTVDPVLALQVLWRECLRPFLPWSACALAGLAFARSRPWSLAYLWALLLHAPITCLFLARASENFHERGAYLLPTAMLAVLATTSLLRGRCAWCLVLVSAAITAFYVVPRWPALYRREFVAAVDQLRHERPVAFLVGPAEIEGIRTELEGVVCAEVIRSLESFYGLTAGQQPAMPLPAWFDAMLPVLGGPERVWCVTREAQQCFLQSSDAGARSLWRDHVPRTYELEVLQRPGLDGVLLRRRP